uniref:Uncharacterized protein n=1 Tax=Candidatus Methanogaster sp. ANME-2c ERB4 TaxID=2759911 RepID=A0A7G9YKT2_9EURY|nr:hypothetical protein LKGCFIDI_00018 [Methanosarcinales archaeon ANME-2c ERB4]
MAKNFYPPESHVKREIEGDEIEEIDRKIKEVFG